LSPRQGQPGIAGLLKARASTYRLPHGQGSSADFFLREMQIHAILWKRLKPSMEQLEQ
jgi:hypothetical protein